MWKKYGRQYVKEIEKTLVRKTEEESTKVRSICGEEKALFGPIYKACENVRRLKPVIIHCGKYKTLSSVMEPMVLIMNFFFYHRLNLHQFWEFGYQDEKLNTLTYPNIQQLDDLGVVVLS